MSTQRELPRVLGVWSAASILIGSIIGSGVFVKPGTIAAELPSPGLILLCWIVAGILALIGSLVFAELGSYYPNAGGQYTFLREAYGDRPAFLFGWTNLTIINTGSLAALAVVCAEFAFNLLPEGARPAPTSHWRSTLPALFICSLTAANIVGARSGAAVQNILTVAKLAAIALAIAAVAVPSRTDWGHFVPFWEVRGGAGRETSLLTGLKEAFLAIFWAYDGWYLLSFSGGEIKDPRRNIPGGFVMGILIVIGVYVAVNVAYLAVLPLEEMAGYKTGGGVAGEAILRAFGPVGLTVLSVGIVCSTLGAANGNVLTGPRLIFAMSRDRLFFRGFDAVHARFLTPVPALVLQAVLGVIYVYAATFRALTDYVVFAAWIFYLLTVAGCFRLRRRHLALEGVFRAPGHPVLPLCFVLFAAAFVVYNLYDSVGLVRQYFVSPEGGESGLFVLLSAGVILLGIPVDWLVRLDQRRGRS